MNGCHPHLLNCLPACLSLGSQSPVFGVVYVPASTPPKTYFGVKGSGAFVRVEGDENPRPIHVQGEAWSAPPSLTATRLCLPMMDVVLSEGPCGSLTWQSSVRLTQA